MNDSSIKNNLKNFEIAFIYAALFMYGLMYNTITPAAMMYVMVAIVAIDAVAFGRGHLKVDFNLHLLTVFSIMMMSYDEFTMPDIPAWRSSWHYAIIFPLSYLIGKIIVNISKTNYEEVSKNALIAMGAGFLIQTILNYSMNYTTGAMDTETWPSFFEHEMFSRNNYEYGFFFVTTALIYVLIERKKNKALALAVVVLNVLIQYLGVRWEGRLNAGVLIIELGLMIPIYLYNHTKASGKNYNKLLIIVVLAIIFIATFIGLAFNLNWFGFKDAYLRSYWSGSGGIIHNVRFVLIKEGLRSSIKYPLGGWNLEIHDSGSTHNAYLEWSRNYGILPWILIEFFRVISLVQVLRLTINRNSNNNLRYWLLPLWIALNIYLSFDPAGFYRRYNLIPFLVLSGIICDTEKKEIIQREKIYVNSFDAAFYLLSIGTLVSSFFALKEGQLELMYVFMLLPAGYAFGRIIDSKKAVMIIIVGLIANTFKIGSLNQLELIYGGIGQWIYIQRQVIILLFGEYQQGFYKFLIQDGTAYSLFSDVGKYYGVIPFVFFALFFIVLLYNFGNFIICLRRKKSVLDIVLFCIVVQALVCCFFSGNVLEKKVLLTIHFVGFGVLSERVFKNKLK